MKIDYKTHTRPGRVLVIKDVTGIFPQYRPVQGRIYQAEIVSSYRKPEFCVIQMKDKKIILRRSQKEREYLEVTDNA